LEKRRKCVLIHQGLSCIFFSVSLFFLAPLELEKEAADHSLL